MGRFQLQRRRKPGSYSDIENEVFRSECISYAATGMSRRGVAAAVGKPESTIRTWVERGLAYPEEEPWGSFAVQYRRAERGLENAAARTAAMKVQLMREQLEEFFLWRTRRGEPPLKPREPKKPGKRATDVERERYREDVSMWEIAMQRYELLFAAWSTPPTTPDVAELTWLERLRESRWPEDHGASKHRKPEPEHDGANYLDAHTMEREQLGALFADPPEPIRLALVDSAAQVYAVLLAGGFDPARKAEDETK